MKYLIPILLLSLISCGGIKIKGLDEAVDKIADRVEESSDQTEDEGYEYTSFEDYYADNQEEPSPDDFSLVTETYSGAERYHVGTYQINYSTCEYFPNVLRLYTYNDIVYLENNSHELFASAEIFSDDTFDILLTVYGFGDFYSDPCTCAYKESYFYGTEVSCECDSGCGTYYKEM